MIDGMIYLYSSNKDVFDYCGRSFLTIYSETGRTTINVDIFPPDWHTNRGPDRQTYGGRTD